MPIINVKVGAAKTPERTRAIAAILIDSTTRILHKRADLIAIAIEYIDPDDWIVAGLSLRELGRSSVYVDIKITDETNTKDEKARFVRETYDALARLLGDLHEESYLYVHDVRATAYGYGGRTQEARYHAP